jgi:hypothetical protein
MESGEKSCQKKWSTHEKVVSVVVQQDIAKMDGQHRSVQTTYTVETCSMLEWRDTVDIQSVSSYLGPTL